MNEVSSFSISDFCAGVRSRLPSSRLASLIFFRMSRSWLAARFAAEAGIVEFVRKPAESLPKEANRSRCCSIGGWFRGSGRTSTPPGAWPAPASSARDPETARPEIARRGYPVCPPAHGKLLHPRKRKHSGNIARRPEKKTTVSPLKLAPPCKLPLKNHKHGIRGIALAQVGVAGLEMQFLRLGDEPGDLIVRQIGERGTTK
jgi:hypothetical protein